MTAVLPGVPAVQRGIEFLEALCGDPPLEHVGFEFWDGTLWPDDRPRAATIVLKHPDALPLMFSSGEERALAEAFLHDDCDVRGDLEAACELADRLAQRGRAEWRRVLQHHYRLRRITRSDLPRSWWRSVRDFASPLHSPARDRRAVSFHYDTSNEFFSLWLDPQMQYSCAYFEAPRMTLEAAQEAKLHHLCRKLRLQPRQRLLDIGCGWGGLALFAARHYCVQVAGITLSQQQADLARERVLRAGCQADVTIECRDYRDLPDEAGFDAIVSVGMSEHVGRAQLGAYFGKAARLLRPGGVFLNHAIGEGVRRRGDRGPSFIEEHVFPDSDIPALPLVLAAAEGAGLEVRDVENLREHYVLTLRRWVGRLEAAHGAARAWVDEPTYRVWRLYMAASAHGFEVGHLGIYQALLVRPDAAGASRLPLTRRDWYMP
jgi:cyclopropane-fatty-acyl-phospholipid synthase